MNTVLEGITLQLSDNIPVHDYTQSSNDNSLPSAVNESNILNDRSLTTTTLACEHPSILDTNGSLHISQADNTDATLIPFNRNTKNHQDKKAFIKQQLHLQQNEFDAAFDSYVESSKKRKGFNDTEEHQTDFSISLKKQSLLGTVTQRIKCDGFKYQFDSSNDDSVLNNITNKVKPKSAVFSKKTINITVGKFDRALESTMDENDLTENNENHSNDSSSISGFGTIEGNSEVTLIRDIHNYNRFKSAVSAIVPCNSWNGTRILRSHSKSQSTSLSLVTKVFKKDNDKKNKRTKKIFTEKVKRIKANIHDTDLYTYCGSDIRKPVFPEYDFWCSPRLYNYLIGFLKSKHGIKTNKKVVSLVKNIYENVEEAMSKTAGYQKNVKMVKKLLWENNVISTTMDFFDFVNNYTPVQFQVRVRPSICGPSKFEFNVKDVFKKLNEEFFR